MGPEQSDHYKRLITWTKITLSGFYCTSLKIIILFYTANVHSMRDLFGPVYLGVYSISFFCSVNKNYLMKLSFICLTSSVKTMNDMSFSKCLWKVVGGLSCLSIKCNITKQLFFIDLRHLSQPKNKGNIIFY
jgi:hypothetical protein